MHRYWNKPLWGAVYLTLLNSALFKPRTSAEQEQQQQQQQQGDNYSVKLLRVLQKALLEHINSVPSNISEVSDSLLCYAFRAFIFP